MSRFNLLVAGVVLAASFAAAGELTIVSKAEDKRPAVWRDADGQAALKAEEAARIDAWAKLAEFVGGMEIKGATSVKNLVDVSKGITGTLRTRLDKMTTEDIVYHENGVVQCKVSAKISDLVESIESYLKESKASGAIASSKSFRKYNLDADDRTLVMWGNGALEGTDGVAVVQALRAAELAAMEQMVAMLEGIQLGRETIVKDFALASDRIKACVDDSSKGLMYDAYRILPSIVEVDASVKFVSIIERIERVYEEVYTTDLCTGCPLVDKNEFEQVVKREETRVHKATGKAAIKEIGKGTTMARSVTRPAGVKSETVRETVEKSAFPGGEERVVRRETIEEKVVKESIGF